MCLAAPVPVPMMVVLDALLQAQAQVQVQVQVQGRPQTTWRSSRSGGTGTGCLGSPPTAASLQARPQQHSLVPLPTVRTWRRRRRSLVRGLWWGITTAVCSLVWHRNLLRCSNSRKSSWRSR